MNKTSKVRSKLLPIYIVKRNADNTKTLSRKKVNFQINFGNLYHINYKYFTPKGFHIASDSSHNVACRYTNDGLNVPSITFSYVKDSKAKPIRVNYIDVDNNQRVQTGVATGSYGKDVNVTQQVTVPSGYHLLSDQKVHFKINKYIQSIDLMIKAVPKPDPTKAVKHHHDAEAKAANSDVSRNSNEARHSRQSDAVTVRPKHSDDLLHNNLSDSIEELETNLQKYDCSVSVKLIHEVLHHNLDFFKKVIMSIFANMKYKDINNLQIDSRKNKVSGVIKKCLYNNNQVNFTFVRAKRCSIHDQITVDEVRDFVTSVIDHNCSKGIFITTSHFSPKAKKEAERHSIILVNDMHLAKLMINNNVGVKPRQILKIVDLDKNFFK